MARTKGRAARWAVLLGVVSVLSGCSFLAPAEQEPLDLAVPDFPSETVWTREEGEGPPYESELRCRLEPDGTLFCWFEPWSDWAFLWDLWGADLDQCPISYEPVVLMKDVVQADVCTNHLICLKADGTVWTFGYNSYGQLGTGTEQDMVLEPVRVLEDCVAVDTDWCVSAALGKNGDLYTWGDNQKGVLGDGQSGYQEPIDPSWQNPVHKKALTPAVVLSDVTAMSFETDDKGRLNGRAVDRFGAVYLWGESYGPTPEASE